MKKKLQYRFVKCRRPIVDMRKISDLELKSPVTVKAGQTVFEVCKTLDDAGIGATPVMNDSGELAGIFTERDLLRKVVSKGLDPNIVAIDQVMTSKVTTIAPNQTIQDANVLMNDLRCRHLPVIENGNLIAVISIRDVMQSLMQDVIDNFMAS